MNSKENFLKAINEYFEIRKKYKEEIAEINKKIREAKKECIKKLNEVKDNGIYIIGSDAPIRDVGVDYRGETYISTGLDWSCTNYYIIPKDLDEKFIEYSDESSFKILKTIHGEWFNSIKRGQYIIILKNFEDNSCFYCNDDPQISLKKSPIKGIFYGKIKEITDRNIHLSSGKIISSDSIMDMLIFSDKKEFNKEVKKYHEKSKNSFKDSAFYRNDDTIEILSYDDNRQSKEELLKEFKEKPTTLVYIKEKCRILTLINELKGEETIELSN